LPLKQQEISYLEKVALVNEDWLKENLDVKNGYQLQAVAHNKHSLMKLQKNKQLGDLYAYPDDEVGEQDAGGPDHGSLLQKSATQFKQVFNIIHQISPKKRVQKRELKDMRQV
jgi:hypothetical protein